MTVKLYTGYGDKGCTFTKRNPKTPKYDKLINLIGEIDDLNSHIGYLVYLLDWNLYPCLIFFPYVILCGFIYIYLYAINQ
jgi:cob(I)alamin adenosyltransferase